MKKISNITLVALIALSTVSCQDWLEMPSENKFESGTIFETISRAESVVLGCYPQTFDREIFYQLGMGSDACISTEGETNSKNQMANYVYTTSNAPAGCYTAMFKGIEFANVAIKGLRNMTASSNAEQTKINMLLGEALAIRGLNYSNLVRFYGDVPHPMLPFADLGTFNLSRVDRDIIYDDCIKDLQEATDLLPWKSAGLIVSPERFTKNAAYGILARVALYAAGTSLRWDLKTYDPATLKLAQRSDKTRIKELYKIAADACEKVINQKENKLIKYETVFRNLVQTKYNEEMMLTFGQMGENVNGSRTGYTNGMFCHTNSVFGKAGPAMVALSTYYYDFEEGDTRRDVAICNYGITSGNIRKMNNYVNNTIGKFRVTWKEEGGTAASKRDISFPILRYSDVLLMYAEAL
ncbi:MAG: RagB/SusD family nutrient uptake outer membrane protein, partial [Bacteroides sp.]